jgi:hypothetical protein
MKWQLIGPRRPIDPRTGTQKACDAIKRIDRSMPVQTRSAMTLAAIDRALSGAQRGADALKCVDRSASLYTRSAMMIHAIDQALAQRQEAIELVGLTPCHHCEYPLDDPGLPCPRCHDGTVGVRSSSYDVRPVGAKVERRNCGAILSIR